MGSSDVEGQRAYEASPQEETPNTNEASEQNKGPSEPRRKRNLGLVLAFCLVVLVAVLVGLVPDWNSNDETVDRAISAENNKDNSNNGGGDDFKQLFTEFDPLLPFFDENITKGYENQQDFENDLSKFALFTMNQVINGTVGSNGNDIWYGRGCGDFLFFDGPGIIAMPSVGVPPPNAPPISSESPPGGSGGSDFFNDVNSFETNNQEEGIDTADQTKSDGTYLYSAYGDTLLVMMALNGEIKAQVQLPPIKITKPPEWQDPRPESPPIESSSNASAASKTRSAIPPFYDHDPKPQINALLLEGDRLTLVVSGYGEEYISSTSSSQPVLCNYLGTRIMVYDTNQGDPKLLSQKDVHGSFRQAYSILNDGQQKVGHIVTTASINTWDHLKQPIQRYNFPKNLTDAEYRQEAIKKAQKLVPVFVSKLSSVLNGIDLTRLSLFAKNIKDEATLDGILSQLRVAESISMVSSFDMDDSSSESSTDLTVSVSGTMQPGFWGHVYANTQTIVLADKGWGFVDDADEYVEMTYLTGFRLNGASTKHEIVGSTRGSPLNPYSIDLVEEGNMLYVRMATTMNFWRNPINNGTSTESTTWNEIVVLGTEKSASLLEKRSSVRLGKPNERFTAVRFMDDLAYAVTFLRRDPFYAIDLSNPDDIQVLGELDISGFSEYLHPIKGEKILAVGKETDDDGMVLGLQISLFGASDPKNLTLINRLVIENDENQWSSSGVSWEPKAFRFFTIADMGILIIPLNVNSYGHWVGNDWKEPSIEDNIQGFVVFTVENDSITRRFDIDHLDFMNNTSTCNSWCGSLPERSFVIAGNILTLKSQSIVSTDLSTEKAEWFLDVRNTVCCK